ncbi:MAG: hypothetical protein A2033_12820 [Bacteroidetes bacterium GWA2_31_9]|nr:MAG: hypothetical protein A2033_12820 [Bacteroidetes bacterium GWA2_31_9]
METQFKTILITLLVSTLLGFITSKLANNKTLSVKSLILLIFSIVLSSFIIVSVNYISLNKSRALVGTWVEKYYESDSVSYYSIANIKQNWFTNDVCFYGSSYDSSGAMIGEWESVGSIVNFSTVHPELKYFFEGQSFLDKKNNSNIESNKAPTRGGSGEIRFDENTKKGRGYFLSFFSDPKPRKISLVKIEDVSDLKQIAEDGEKKKFIINIYLGKKHIDFE